MHQLVYDKLERDTVISLDDKNDLLLACSTCLCEERQQKGVSDNSVEHAFDGFCWSKSGVGDGVSLLEGETVGHVKVFEDWVDRLFSMAEKNGGGDPRDLIYRHMCVLSGLAGRVTSSQRFMAKRWADLTLLGGSKPENAIKLTGPVCFIFRSDDDTGVDTIFKADAKALPCRLGLPSFLDEASRLVPGFTQDYIGYVFEGGKLENTRTTTAFHPGYRSVRDLWDIGGKTIPHPAGPAEDIAKGGLPELVCDQVSIVDAGSEIYGFTVRN